MTLNHWVEGSSPSQVTHQKAVSHNDAVFFCVSATGGGADASLRQAVAILLCAGCSIGPIGPIGPIGCAAWAVLGDDGMRVLLGQRFVFASAPIWAVGLLGHGDFHALVAEDCGGEDGAGFVEEDALVAVARGVVPEDEAFGAHFAGYLGCLLSLIHISEPTRPY